ncbi:hypothetical protein MyNCGM121_19470 [Achromobacter xylosoxidans]
MTAIVAARGRAAGTAAAAAAIPTRLTTLDIAAAKSDTFMVPGAVSVNVFLMFKTEEERERTVAPAFTGISTDFPIICTTPTPTWIKPVAVP